MVSLYCHNLHDESQVLCPECKELLSYGLARLDRCPFQEQKPPCSQCPIHCYQPDMKEKVRAVMRYAGPRMLYHHPILAILHLLDEKKKVDTNTLRVEAIVKGAKQNH